MQLLIYDVSKAIQYAQTILDFILLAQYFLYDDEMLFYIVYTLYRLENIKIAFEYYQPIDSKLYQLIFNYPKFYTITQFV